MRIETHKTVSILPGDSLLGILDTHLPPQRERSILVVTSKIVSLCEGSIATREQEPSKRNLVRKMADAYLEEEEKDSFPERTQLTIKNNLLIPAAGIDESNGNGIYILYPRSVQSSAAFIWEYVRNRDHLEAYGVLITDSHTTPLRRGVTGIGLGWCGFRPLYDYIGKPDCFGHPLRITMVNILDALAAAAVFCMGEGNEQTPLCTISDAPKIDYQPRPPTQEEVDEIFISMEEDLYAPLLKGAIWRKHHEDE